jgi:hypothetical protein
VAETPLSHRTTTDTPLTAATAKQVELLAVSTVLDAAAAWDWNERAVAVNVACTSSTLPPLGRKAVVGIVRFLGSTIDAVVPEEAMHTSRRWVALISLADTATSEIVGSWAATSWRVPRVTASEALLMSTTTIGLAPRNINDVVGSTNINPVLGYPVLLSDARTLVAALISMFFVLQSAPM